MIRALLLTAALLAGCSIQQMKSATTLDDLDYSRKDGACSRSCIDTYSSCLRGAGLANGTADAADIATGCKSAVKACVSTCPDKP